MRETLIKAAVSHAQGHINKHLANIEVYMNNPVGVGEHPDIMEAIEMELEQVAKYDDQVEMIKKYFLKKQHESRENTVYKNVCLIYNTTIKTRLEGY